MVYAGLALAGLAALLHVYIFVIESLRFEAPSTLRAFGIRPEEAAVMKPWAYNQGFYNLFLAIGAAIGIGIEHSCGPELVLFCCASMLAAALVLVTSDRTKARGAIIQGTAPALALLFLLVSL
ncbi:MAG TPA: DUF1304 domain-containing protein [Nocardioides sp.]|jgi:putative membrane protein